MVTASEGCRNTRKREVSACTEACLLGTEPGKQEGRQVGRVAPPGGGGVVEAGQASSSHRAALLQSGPTSRITSTPTGSQGQVEGQSHQQPPFPSKPQNRRGRRGTVRDLRGYSVAQKRGQMHHFTFRKALLFKETNCKHCHPRHSAARRKHQA